MFGTEPIRRLTLRIGKYSLFRNNPLNHSPFTYHKVALERVELQRGNGVPLAGTPLNTNNNTRLYNNTIRALGFGKNGNRIKQRF